VVDLGVFGPQLLGRQLELVLQVAPILLPLLDLLLRLHVAQAPAVQVPAGREIGGLLPALATGAQQGSETTFATEQR